MIGILTFQRTTNYGSMLQAFAVYCAVGQQGIPCEIIDYECSKVEKNEMPLTLKNCTSVKKILRYLLINKYRKKKLEKFEHFRSRYIKFSPERYDSNTISLANQRYSGYVVGSDIVWGPEITGDDMVYFLNFSDTDKLKISYAASLGENIYESKEKIEKNLKAFDFLSIREYSGKQLIEELSGKIVKTVLDPTLLFSADFWKRYCSKRQVKEKYILVYFALDPDKVFQKVRELAVQKGYKIVYIQDTLRQPKDFINVRSASIEEFLSYIQYAELVVTGSYHGVAFSINFNKQFITNNIDYTDRIQCLLKETGIGERGMEFIDPFKEEIDYSKVNSSLEELRIDSKKWLEDVLNDYDAANM